MDQNDACMCSGICVCGRGEGKGERGEWLQIINSPHHTQTQTQTAKKGKSEFVPDSQPKDIAEHSSVHPFPAQTWIFSLSKTQPVRPNASRTLLPSNINFKQPMDWSTAGLLETALLIVRSEDLSLWLALVALLMAVSVSSSTSTGSRPISIVFLRFQ